MSTGSADSRNIATGWPIPSEGYCDQPYVVINRDGDWVCVMTTGAGVEGEPGQHVVSMRSTDRGRTWSKPVPIEPAEPPESSWGMPLIVPSRSSANAMGRIYVFYLYNADNMREVIIDGGGTTKRVDTLGRYMFRYSDDGGRTWSADRYEVPIRLMDIDRRNPYGGNVRFFWGVGKPIVHNGAAYIGLSKVGSFGEGFLAKSEGILLRSDNILTETDPRKLRWETLPDGEHGLTSPRGGPIAEEQNLVSLSDGSLYCTYRTIEGHNCHAYSRDDGRTWTAPAYATYTPGGRRIKHPRAANFVRKFANGKFLLWFHNHGGRSYEDRNPAWVCGGVEKGGHIHWSQPEILLYDDNPDTRMSYPDFIEDGGRIYVTETKKDVARTHEVNPRLLDLIWKQHDLAGVASDGLVLELTGEDCRRGTSATMPDLPDLSAGGGFSIDFRMKLRSLDDSQVLLDSRAGDGRGILVTVAGGSVRISLSDGGTVSSWDSDQGVFRPDTWHHVTVTVDGGPRIITFVVDGILCDGGGARQFGWGRFSQHLRSADGAAKVRIAPDLDGEFGVLRVYDRYLLTSEAVGNFRAGAGG